MSSRLRAIGLRLPRGRQRPPRWLLAVAIAAIAAGAFFAIRSLPDDLEHFVWWPIAAIAVLVVPGVTLNGYEYLVTARLSGVTVRLLAAVRIAIYGTAANLLPLPGASLVRIEAMRRSGASLGRATKSTAAVGVAWLAASLVAAGLVLLPRGLIALPPLAAGAAALAVLVAVLARGRTRRETLRAVATILAVELAFVVTAAAKLWFAMTAIGADPSVAAALTIGVSGVLASATGFLPGGLGLREGLAAALGPLVGIDPSIAFLAVLIDRIVSLSALALIATAMLASERRLGGGGGSDELQTSPPEPSSATDTSHA